jgi:hypothetical protein
MDLRFPGQAAKVLGVSVNTLKVMAKTDPAFPAVQRLTARVQRVRESELLEFAERKRVKMTLIPAPQSDPAGKA